MKILSLILVSLSLAIALAGCNEKEAGTGKISITFEELVDDFPLTTDSMVYTNAAGNEYLVTEVQYFISGLRLYYQDGTSYLIQDQEGIHYRDTDLPETKKWSIADEVPAGIIDSITFIFGLDQATNVTGRFPNPPESNMFWPENLGGGYHYMKLNGKWLSVNSEILPFNYHMGIGQIYDQNGNVTEFVQNFFTVRIFMQVYSSFILSVKDDETTDLALNMNIQSWFVTPNLWDFRSMGGMMMQNQFAQQKARENGFDVFTIGPLHDWK